jgi:hypothetical protein
VATNDRPSSGLTFDGEQLPSIEVGWPFAQFRKGQGIARAGTCAQHEAWKREVSRGFTRGEPGRQLALYREDEAIHIAASCEQAEDELIRL